MPDPLDASPAGSEQTKDFLGQPAPLAFKNQPALPSAAGALGGVGTGPKTTPGGIGVKPTKAAGAPPSMDDVRAWLQQFLGAGGETGGPPAGDTPEGVVSGVSGEAGKLGASFLSLPGMLPGVSLGMLGPTATAGRFGMGFAPNESLTITDAQGKPQAATALTHGLTGNKALDTLLSFILGGAKGVPGNVMSNEQLSQILSEIPHEVTPQMLSAIAEALDVSQNTMANAQGGRAAMGGQAGSFGPQGGFDTLSANRAAMNREDTGNPGVGASPAAGAPGTGPGAAGTGAGSAAGGTGGSGGSGPGGAPSSSGEGQS